MAIAAVLLLPAVLLYSLSCFSSTTANTHTPLVAHPITRYAIVLTATLVIKRILALAYQHHKARSRNAVLFQQLHSWVPFNLGIIFTAIWYQGKVEPGSLINPIFQK